MTDDDFAPGCYLHLRPGKPESFAGYLLRLAEANSYAGIPDFFKAVLPGRLPPDLPRAFLALRASREDLEWLGKVGAADAKALLRYRWTLLPDGALFYQDCRIEPDALLAHSAQVCPACLGEFGTALEEWDLAPVVACPRHGIELLDICTCGAPINWRRQELHFCPCGNDLRELPVTSAAEASTATSADFGSLAPFRVGLMAGVESIRWDSMFLVAKSASLGVQAWTAGEWPEGVHFRALTTKDRAAAVNMLGNCQVEGTYNLTELSAPLLAALRPLEAIPVPHVVGARAFNLLFSQAALPRSVASALAGYEPVADISGAEVFEGRPPVLGTRADVIGFLDTDEDTLSALLAQRVIYQPSGAELGFDIDVVLHAQRFLRDALLRPEQLSALVGLQIDLGVVRRSLLLRPWNPKAALDARVALADVEAIHLRLVELAAAAAPPANPVRLEQAASASKEPFSWLLQMVARVIDAQATRLAWCPPYRWCDLALEQDFVLASEGSGR